MSSIEISEEKGVRYLHFGSRWIQGAMRIGRPWSLELDYTRDMMLPLLLRDRQWPSTVLQIGLGAASLTRFLYRYRPHARITVVEIDPDVVAAAWQFFKLPADPGRISIEIGDGYEYVAASGRRFDLVLVDGFDARGRAGMLDTAPFYCNCRARLSETGVMAANLLSRRDGPLQSAARIREAFGERVLLLPRCPRGNTIALAAAGAASRHPFGELRASARWLQGDTGLNLLPTLARLEASRAAAGDGDVEL